jgi:hypothetical protein
MRSPAATLFCGNFRKIPNNVASMSGTNPRYVRHRCNAGNPKAVVPAKAGIHSAVVRAADGWVPAFAGTTD